MKMSNHIITFQHFSQIEGLVHGFSTQFFGSMRPRHEEYKASLKNFSNALGIFSEQVITMGQLHTNHVALVSESNSGQVIPETDGLITKEKEIFLGVVTADCVPLLLFDPHTKQVGAIHAGWRGLFSEIIKEAVSQMVKNGSRAQSLLVGIGPCIRPCHYTIGRDRVDELLGKFPHWKEFIIQRDEQYFLDLPSIAMYQLRSMGVLSEHIEDADYCTVDHPDVYSRRRDGSDFKEIMGIIGLRKQ